MENRGQNRYNALVATTTFSVKTENFEGPLDLLLDLVSKRKLFINEVSLAVVADDFVKYIETHEEFPIDESAEFIVVASTLMLIKSRSLLPLLALTEEEESSIEDLENRLELYAKAKELATKLRTMYGKNVIFEKTPSKLERIIFSPDSKTTLEHLSLALQGVLESLPKKEIAPKAVVKKMISLEETILSLSERISKDIRMNFKDIYQAKGNLTHEHKVNIIVGFLALLELVKRGAVRASQDGRGDIELETTDLSVPNYA
jgi:segregation and condensation protein A